jgi:Asp/Glu/hydantoin racemase
MTPRIVLVHAVTPAIAPVEQAFRAQWPSAETVNLLDDSLSPDRARDSALTAAMDRRIRALASYGLSIGAAGILFTCSAFGAAIERAAAEIPIPVLKPNEAMFEAAFSHGDNVGMIATFGPSVAGMEVEFAEEATRRNSRARLRTILVDHALDALKAGDALTHDELIAARAHELSGCDAILLAHFSTSRAAEAVRGRVTKPVLTSPTAAVAKLKVLVENQAA